MATDLRSRVRSWLRSLCSNGLRHHNLEPEKQSARSASQHLLLHSFPDCRLGKNLLPQALAKRIGLEKWTEHLAAPDSSARIHTIAMPEQKWPERLRVVCWGQSCFVRAQGAQGLGHPGLRCQQLRFGSRLPS